MTTGAVAPFRSSLTSERESFWHLVHAEWTKFRTVHGWVIAVLVTIVAIAAFVFISADVSGGLIRVSLTAAPRRGRLLAAKAVVIGATGFVAGLLGAILALAVGTPLLLRAGPCNGRFRCSPRHGWSSAPRRCSPWPRCSPSRSAPSCGAARRRWPS
jgi:hypothetical protein